jgi:hypothetical protein
VVVEDVLGGIPVVSRGQKLASMVIGIIFLVSDTGDYLKYSILKDKSLNSSSKVPSNS